LKLKYSRNDDIAYGKDTKISQRYSYMVGNYTRDSRYANSAQLHLDYKNLSLQESVNEGQGLVQLHSHCTAQRMSMSTPV